jgi:hypothetical protein
MKKASGLVSSLLILFGVLFSQDCATLTRSSTQRIPVTSSPVGAMVVINGQQWGPTPLQIWLARKEKDQVIRIESAGYNPFEIRVKRGTSGGALLGDVFLGAATGFVATWLAAIIAHEDLISLWGEPTSYEKALDYMIPAGIAGLTLIDLGVGKIYTLKPKELNVILTRVEGTPRVDTLLMDADDFQSVKWIRVHRD